jgi:hypothetical protein
MGKKSRKRAAKAEPKRWTVALGARQALRYKQDLLANYRGNPYVHAMGVAEVETTLEHWRTMPGLGSQRRRLRRAILEYAGHNIAPDTPDLVNELARYDTNADHEMLTKAEIYVISPGMHAATVAAAETIEPADLETMPTEADLPSQDGLLVLPHIQLVKRAEGDTTADVRALTWRVKTVHTLKRNLTRRAAQISTWVDSDGPVQVPNFVAVRRAAKEHGHPLIGLMPEYGNTLYLERPHRSKRQLRRVLRMRQHYHDTLVDRWPDRSGQVVGQYTGSIIDDADGQFTSRYLYAFWRLCAQRIVTVDRRGELAERGPGLLPTDDEDDIRIVRLRSFSPHDDNAEPSGRQYRHRWIVRMHKVRQWYPSEQTHKVLWRGPYVKGPDGAPLLNEERVNALIR